MPQIPLIGVRISWLIRCRNSVFASLAASAFFADEGLIVASNDESLLGQNTADNEVVKAMKRNTDSQYIYHLKNEGTGCYGIMLKQRDYYIYAYLSDTEVFHNLPLNVISVIFLYFLMFSIFWFWTYRTKRAHQKLEQAAMSICDPSSLVNRSE